MNAIQPGRPPRLAATILVVLLAGIAPSVIAHSPDPILSGSAWPQHEGLDLPLANQRRPRAGDPDRRPRGRRRQQRHEELAGGHLHLQQLRRRPHRLRTWSDLRRQRHRLLHPGCARWRLHHVAA